MFQYDQRLYTIPGHIDALYDYNETSPCASFYSLIKNNCLIIRMLMHRFIPEIVHMIMGYKVCGMDKKYKRQKINQ